LSTSTAGVMAGRRRSEKRTHTGPVQQKIGRSRYEN